MITGYGGFYGEPENQGYYVGAADAVDFQYPVSFLSWFMVFFFFVMMILLGLWFSLSMWLTCCMSE
jgi:hypothetical protein